MTASQTCRLAAAVFVCLFPFCLAGAPTAFLLFMAVTDFVSSSSESELELSSSGVVTGRLDVAVA